MPSNFRGKTLAALVRALALHGHSELSVLATEHEVEATGSNRTDRALSLVRNVEQTKTDADSRVALLEIAQFCLASNPYRLTDPTSLESAVERALTVEGYIYSEGKLLPAIPGPLLLSKASSELELSLAGAGLGIAARHYSQAIDAFVDGKAESSNSQLRSAFEHMAEELCAIKTGTTFDNPIAALQQLQHRGSLVAEEFQFFKSLWNIIQTNGPHAGMSSPEEARFRFITCTAAMRYLLTILDRD